MVGVLLACAPALADDGKALLPCPFGIIGSRTKISNPLLVCPSRPNSNEHFQAFLGHTRGDCFRCSVQDEHSMRAWLSNRSLQSRLVTRPWPALPAMVATDPRIVWPRQGPGAVPGKGKGTSPFTPSPITSGQIGR